MIVVNLDTLITSEFWCNTYIYAKSNVLIEIYIRWVEKCYLCTLKSMLFKKGVSIVRETKGCLNTHWATPIEVKHPYRKQQVWKKKANQEAPCQDFYFFF